MDFPQTDMLDENQSFKIKSLQNYYLPMTLDTVYSKLKKKNLVKLDLILRNFNVFLLDDNSTKYLIYSALTGVYYHGLHLNLCKHKRRLHIPCSNWEKNLVIAEKLVQKTYSILPNDKNLIVIGTTLDFYAQVNLWQYETIATDILAIASFYQQRQETVYRELINNINLTLTHGDLIGARRRIRILYGLIKKEQNIGIVWLNSIDLLLKAYLKSIYSKEEVYQQVKKGFKVCIIKIAEIVDNDNRLDIIVLMLNWFATVSEFMDSRVIKEYAYFMDEVTQFYVVSIYPSSLDKKILESVMDQLVSSTDFFKSYVGCRILYRFFDRLKNAPLLTSMEFFYSGSQHHLEIGIEDLADVKFLKEVRGKLHNNIIKALELHGDKEGNLNSVYTFTCCLVLEVPSAFTVSAVAYLAMNVQYMALKHSKLSSKVRAYMHVFVISVLSIVAWVHNCQHLFKYIIGIHERRQREAPYLNPPIVTKIEGIDLNEIHRKPNLFFEDWELRYGVWQHFKDIKGNNILTLELRSFDKSK